MFVSVRDVPITGSLEIAQKYFTGSGEPFNGFSPVDRSERTQIFVALNKIQAFWISDTPFESA